MAGLFLVMAAVATLAFPLALRSLIDGGLVSADTSPAARGAQLLSLQQGKRGVRQRGIRETQQQQQ